MRVSSIARRTVSISACAIAAASPAAVTSPSPVDDVFYQSTILAGDPGGVPVDSPALRVDPNVPTSPWAGTASIFIGFPGGSSICTGVAISERYVLTAGHCVDRNDNGTLDGFGTASPEIWQLSMNVNRTATIESFAAHPTLTILHPDYTGFNNPTVNDDLALLQLTADLPPEIPIVPLYRDEVNLGDTLQLVGYGLTGNGVTGYASGSSSFQNKRVGANVVDLIDVDDEGSGANELFYYDFDAPDGSNGNLGGPSLGNDVETAVGPGDSGGPAYINDNGVWKIAGVNTFAFGFSAPPNGQFGEGGGGVLLHSYLDWIDGIAGTAPAAGVYVPEPQTALLLLLGIGAFAMMRRGDVQAEVLRTLTRILQPTSYTTDPVARTLAADPIPVRRHQGRTRIRRLYRK